VSVLEGIRSNAETGMEDVTTSRTDATASATAGQASTKSTAVSLLDLSGWLHVAMV